MILIDIHCVCFIDDYLLSEPCCLSAFTSHNLSFHSLPLLSFIFSLLPFLSTDSCFHVIYKIHTYNLCIYTKPGSTNERKVDVYLSKAGLFSLYVDDLLHPFSSKFIITLLIFKALFNGLFFMDKYNFILHILHIFS